MLYFFAFFLLLTDVIVANPVPQSLSIATEPVTTEDTDSLDLDPGVYTLDAADSSNDPPECISDVDENIDGFDQMNIFRRKLPACPAVLNPAIHQKVPFTRQRKAPPDIPTKPEESNNACNNLKYPKHVSCGGPEGASESQIAIKIVFNCVSGPATVIAARHNLLQTTDITQYCCLNFYDKHPPWPASDCIRLTPYKFRKDIPHTVDDLKE